MALSSAAILGLAGVASGLFSGIGNFGSSAYSSKKAFKYAIQAMNHQYNLTRQLNQNAYQDTTYSMRQAGINPMLAITQGVNGLSAGSGISTPVSDPKLGDSAFGAYQDYKRLKNETELKDSQKEVNDSTIASNSANARSSREQSDFIRTQKEILSRFGSAKAELENLKILQDIQNSKDLTKAQINNLHLTGQASITSAKSSYINATQGSAYRDLSDKVINPLSKSKTFKKIKNYAKSLDDFVSEKLLH